MITKMNSKRRKHYLYNKHTASSKSKISRKVSITVVNKKPREVEPVSAPKPNTSTKTRKPPSKLNIIPNIQFKPLPPPKMYPLSPKLPTIIEESNDSCELEVLIDKKVTNQYKPPAFFQKTECDSKIQRCVVLSSKLTEEILDLKEENSILKEEIEHLKIELKKVKHVKTNQSI